VDLQKLHEGEDRMAKGGNKKIKQNKIKNKRKKEHHQKRRDRTVKLRL